jgi:DNA-binding NarL/FixJ family response regulator
MIKILIADDHAIVRQGLKQILAETSDLVAAGESQDAEETLRKVRSGDWDVLILDLTLPDKSGLDLLKQIKQERPRLPVLVLSIHPEDQYAIRVLRAGASGYLPKGSVPEALVKAVRKVASGGKYISPTVAEKLAFNLKTDSERPPHESLSDREFQVLCLIASGKAVKEVAKELLLSVKTVSTYRTRILKKMDLKTSAELIRYAMKNRLID